MNIQDLVEKHKELLAKVPYSWPPGMEKKVIPIMGMIEEACELYGALGIKTWRPFPLPRENQLEELVDILFFWVEAMILNGFTWEEVSREYERKHAENLERYERAEKGDWSWDKRGQGL